MFLYTVCPACQASYDLTDLLRGKKIRCKGCAHVFSVTAAPRPRHLPAPAPFARLQPPKLAAELTAPRAAASRDLATAYERPAALGKAGPQSHRVPASEQQSPSLSKAGGWFGRGGVGIAMVVAFLLIRGCLSMTSRQNYQSTPYIPPPQVVPQPQQWDQLKMPVPKFEHNEFWKPPEQPPGGRFDPNRRNGPGQPPPGGGFNPNRPGQQRPPFGKD